MKKSDDRSRRRFSQGELHVESGRLPLDQQNAASKGVA